MTLYDWITNDRGGGPNSWMGALLNAGYNEEYGAETTGQSSLNLIYLLGYQASPGNFSIYGKSDERYHIVGGNQQLPETIAQYLGYQNVKLGWALQAIKANADGTVALSCTTPVKNTTVTADHVMLC